MNRCARLALIITALACAACAHPTVPEWEERAHEAFEQYRRDYFDGEASADRQLQRGADALASTGKVELRARGELIRCALATAALDFDRCSSWQALQADASPEDRAYGALLSGKFDAVDVRALPPQYVDLAKARDAGTRNGALAKIDDPVSRLVGAGALFRAGDLSPAGMALAVETASEQGWRRPLLAWLTAQARLMEATGDTAALERTRRRIDVVAPERPCGKGSENACR